MKKSRIALLLLVFVLLGSFADPVQANPIDQAFAGDFSQSLTTVELNFVSEKYAQAWKAELDHIAVVMKQQYHFDEDKAHVDAYVTAYEQAAQAAGLIEWINWSDSNAAPVGRHFGTGAASASMSAQANVYKQAALQLITLYQGQSGERNTYSYAYSGQGACLKQEQDSHRQGTKSCNETKGAYISQPTAGKVLAAAAPGNSQRKTTGISAEELTGIELLNRDRKQQGLPPLIPDPQLTKVARAHAEDMVAQNYFDHINLQGQSPFDRLEMNGISYQSAGENIAYNDSLEEMEIAWMNSPGHRANILDDSYTHVGLGLCHSEDGSIYGVQLFASH